VELMDPNVHYQRREKTNGRPQHSRILRGEEFGCPGNWYGEIELDAEVVQKENR
jgi:hypothetical protein